jgi:hypothetical protein
MTEKIAQEDRIPILKASQNHLKVSNPPCQIDSFANTPPIPHVRITSFMFHRNSLLYVKYWSLFQRMSLNYLDRSNLILWQTEEHRR